MRIAIPQWQGRISPVFDVAGHLLLIDIAEGRELRREETRLRATETSARVAEFLSFGAGILICGAISLPLQERLTAAGVQVIGFSCGMVDEVLAAFLNGSLTSRAFVMPGCQGCCRRGKEHPAPHGFGKGAGRHGYNRGHGRETGEANGSSFAGQDEGFICPQCGEKAPRAAGPSCQRRLCPKCGRPMI